MEDYSDIEKENVEQDGDIADLLGRVEALKSKIGRLNTWNPYGYGKATPLLNDREAIAAAVNYGWVIASGDLLVKQDMYNFDFYFSKDGGETFSDGLSFGVADFTLNGGIIHDNRFIYSMIKAPFEGDVEYKFFSINLAGDNTITHHGDLTIGEALPVPIIKAWTPSYGIVICSATGTGCWFAKDGTVTSKPVPNVTDMGTGGFYISPNDELFHIAKAPKQVKKFNGEWVAGPSYPFGTHEVERTFVVGEKCIINFKKDNGKFILASPAADLSAWTIISDGEEKDTAFVVMDFNELEYIAIDEDHVAHFGYILGAGGGSLDVTDVISAFDGTCVALQSKNVAYFNRGTHSYRHTRTYTEIPIVPSNPFSSVRIIEKSTGKEANLLIENGQLVAKMDGNTTVIMDVNGNFISAGLVQGHVEEGS